MLRRRKERSGKKAGLEAWEDLEAKLRDKAETLGFSLEQKTKGMKQRDKKVIYTVGRKKKTTFIVFMGVQQFIPQRKFYSTLPCIPLGGSIPFFVICCSVPLSFTSV